MGSVVLAEAIATAHRVLMLGSWPLPLAPMVVTGVVLLLLGAGYAAYRQAIRRWAVTRFLPVSDQEPPSMFNREIVAYTLRKSEERPLGCTPQKGNRQGACSEQYALRDWEVSGGRAMSPGIVGICLS